MHTEVFFDKTNSQERLNQINHRLATEELWNDQKAYKEIMQTKAILDSQLDAYTQAFQEYTSLSTILTDTLDQDLIELIHQDLLKLTKTATDLYTSCKFSHELDSLNCFLHIHAGSGGTEAQDWVRILLNMYVKFCQNRGYKCELSDILKDDSDLIKHVTLNISINSSNSLSQQSNIYSNYPYGWLKHEHGIHRFVRISPFDKNARRHTSFVAVTVTPEFNDTIDIAINPSDLIIKECRSSGAGGQHVNKTNSAIQIKHIPSGIVVESQQDRCQHRNRATAMKMLKSKLYIYEQEKLQAKHQENTMSKDDISWGNQIRSYVLHPYKLVKDLRSKHEEYDVDKVLNGELDKLILSNIDLL